LRSFAADLFASSAFFSAALLAAASADAAACALALACLFFIAASLCLLQSKLLYTTHQLCSQVNNQDCITPWYSGSVISVEVLPGSSCAIKEQAALDLNLL
jgi:hypothetical protein